jgi:uncharacterized protein YdgA (DUF945 family)
MKKLMSVLVLLFTLILGSYYFMGWGTERVLRNNLAIMNHNHGNIIELKTYSRGWFTSDALIKWVVKVPEPATFRIPHSLLMSDRVYVTEIPLHIFHGPIAWPKHKFRFGLGYVESRVLIPTLYDREYNSVFDKNHSVKPVLKITALVSYLANTRLQLEIPAFSLLKQNKTDQFKWLGMITDVKLSGNKTHLAGHLAVDGFSWIEGEMRGVIGSVKSEYNLRRTLDNVYLGNAHLQLASGTLIKGHQQLAQVNDADFSSENNVQDGLFHSRLLFSVKNLAVNRFKFGESHADVSVTNLDSKTLENMNRKVTQSHSHAQEDKQRTLLALVPDLPMLLSKGAQININNLQLTLPEGVLKGNIHISFPTQAVYNPLQMMQKLTGNGTIRLSSNLVKNWLQNIIKAKLQHTNPGSALDNQYNTLVTDSIDAQVAHKLAEKIDYLTAAGILVKDGDDFIMILKLENGKLFINNHIFSPEIFSI